MDTSTAIESARRAEIDHIVAATAARPADATKPAAEPKHRSMRSRLAGVVRELVEDGFEDVLGDF